MEVVSKMLKVVIIVVVRKNVWEEGGAVFTFRIY